MAKQLPLPRLQELPEVVLFHRNHPADPRLLLQVPTGPDTAETYVVRLDQPPAPTGEYDPRTDHRGWIDRLPNSRALMDKLSCDMHVAYYPHHSGTVIVLENPDEIPWVRMVMMLARQEATNPVEQMFRQREMRTRGPAALSPLRMSLGLTRLGGASW